MKKMGVEEYLGFYGAESGRQILKEEARYVRDWLKDCKRVLDVGCGPGVFEEELSDLNIVGLDSSPEMIEVAQERMPDREFRLGRAENIPFPDARFDGIFFVTSLEFIEDYRKAVDEAARVLSKEGRLEAILLNPESNYFKEKMSKGGYIRDNIKHTNLEELMNYLRTKFNILGEEYLLGDKVYAVKGELK